MFGNNTAAEGSVMAVQLSVYNFTSDNVLANNNGTAIADLDSTDSSSHLLVILLAAIGGAILLIIVVACACKYCGKKNRDENQVGLLEN
jgi:K+-transporting ATPase A subunit